MRLLSFANLREAKGITASKVTLWRLERDGLFPKRINPTPGTIAWVEDEIDAWLEAKVAERDAQPSKAA